MSSIYAVLPASNLGPQAPNRKSTSFARYVPGIVLTAALAAGGMALGQIDWLSSHGFSALTIAILLGISVGNTVYPRFAGFSATGVDFSKQKLLRLGVMLYGLRLTVQDIQHVGMTGVLIDAVVLASTFGLAVWIGTRWLGLDRKTAMLIGAGSSICGAAAVMAAEPVVKGRPEQVTVAVATVVVFGTIAIFAYPMLFDLNQHWNIIPGGFRGFGIYAGSTIHEVAQVVAAARSVSPSAADSAVIAKMVRVMMLAPFLVGLSAWLARADRREIRSEAVTSQKSKLAVPWFAFGFVGVVLFNSLHLLPAGVVAATNQVDTILLAMAMAALGLATHVSSIRKAGVKPLLLAAILFGWLIVGGAAINHFITLLLA